MTQESKTTKRAGVAFRLPDQDAELLRDIAAAEDRTYPAVMSRALRAYAKASHDYTRIKRLDKNQDG